MRKAILVWAVAAAAALASPAVAKDKVRFVQSSWGLLYVPVLAADALGYFEHEGIEAEFVTNLGGAEALAAVVGGNAEIYVGAPSTAMRARDKGTDVVVFAPSITQYASNVVVSKKWAAEKGITAESPYPEKLKALKGAHMGVVGIGSGTHQLVQFLAKQAGIDPERDMTISNFGNAQTQLANLAQGRSDGFVFSSPTSDIAVKDQGAVMLFHTSRGEVKALDGFLYIGLIAREAWLKRNEDLAVRTLRAVQRSLDDLHDPQATGKIRDVLHAKYHKNVDPAFFREVWANAIPSWPATVKLEPAMMDRVLAFVNEFEKRPLPPEIATRTLATEYADRALATR